MTDLISSIISNFLRLGTFQIADLCYNTLGGLFGGMIYYIGYRVKNH